MVHDSEKDEKILQKEYFELVKYCVAMLENEKVLSEKRIVLECICHLTNHFDLLAFMKDMGSLKSLLLTLTEVDDCEVSLNVYRILALIMSEDDIKSLKSAGTIIGVFYLYFISMMDDPVQRTAFQSLLHSLTCKWLLLI
jgi:hypothetical protein